MHHYKMNSKINLEKMDKAFSEKCVISENENFFQGIMQWNIPNREIKRCLERGSKPIRSNTFSIGSPAFCSFHFIFLPNIMSNDDSETPGYLKSFSTCIMFNSKLPDCAWIKGKVQFDELDLHETFSVSGKTFQRKIDLIIPCNYSDFDKLLKCISKSDLDFTMHCSLRIAVREVACTFDKESVSYTESRNYSLSREAFKHDFSDVSISIGDHLFMTHKALLAQIPYFQLLFDSTRELPASHFELTDINHEIFNHILTYLYSGDIPRLSFRLACELYIVSSDLKIFDLKNLCSSYLGANLTDVNVVIVLKLSNEYEDAVLKEECFKFIKRSDPATLTKKSIIL